MIMNTSSVPSEPAPTSRFPTFRRFLRPRISREFVFLLLCLVTLVGLGYAVEGWRGRAAWSALVRECAARGDRLDLRSLIPPPVPAEQNLALTPIFSSLLSYERVGAEQRVIWPQTNSQARLEKVDWTLGAGPGRRPPQDLRGFQAIDLAASQAFYRGNTNYPQPTRAGAAAADVLVALSKFDGFFAELAQAAATHPRCRVPVHYDELEAAPFGILLPHLSQFRKLTVILRLRACARLAQGEPQRAFDDLALGLQLADGLAEEPFLVSMLVQQRCVCELAQEVKTGLAHHQWTAPQLAWFEQRLGHRGFLADLRRCFRNEMLACWQTIDNIRRHRARLSEIGDPPGNSPSTFTELAAWFPSGWFFQNKVSLGRHLMDHVWPAVDAQAGRVYPSRALEADTQTDQMKRVTPYNFLLGYLVPAAANLCRRTAYSQTVTDQAALACALETQYLATGHYPETLAVAAAALAGPLPRDPLSGQPYHYRRLPDGSFVLYGVGWNEQDDGGVIPPGKKAVPAGPEGDWIW